LQLTDLSEDTKDRVAAQGKPYIISISGLTLNDNLVMIDKIYHAAEGIAAVELNLACPNIPGKPIVSSDCEQMKAVLQAITRHPMHGTVPLGIKLGPYTDLSHLQAAGEVIVRFPIRFIVCVNTIGNALVIDAENECEGIAANRGLGGLGGGFVKHTALANVRLLRELLDRHGRQDIDVVGTGGVHCGRDAFELILCGATAVQVGSCHWSEGAGCFARIAQELRELMASTGYNCIDDFRGKLQPYRHTHRPSRTKKERKPTQGGAVTKVDTVDQGGINVGDLALKFCFVLLGMALASMVRDVRTAVGL
jgi:dihydroorotate dehydrogenase (fumarate)